MASFAMVECSRGPCQRQNATMKRREGENHEGIERLEPGHRNFAAKKMAVGKLIGPQCDGVALLFVGGPEQAHRREQQQQRDDRLPGSRRSRGCCNGARLTSASVGQIRRGEEINDEAKGHADAGSGKAIVPAELFAERAANQRGEECAEIDADIENRKGAVAAAVAWRIKRADLGRDVRLEGAVAENEQAEREQKQMLEGHHEMADSHQRRRRR